MAILEARGLVKRFGPVTAVDHVSFEVGEGQVIGLLGPNGAGKTTTLHMLLGLVTPDGGSVRLFGEDLAHNRLRALSQVNFAAGYVHLPGALTVEESLIVFARMYAVRRPRQRVNQLVELLDLGELRKRRVRHLSSGQQTRVQIAKALVNEPVLLVLDEPTASLDPDAGDRVRQLLLRLARETAGDADHLPQHARGRAHVRPDPLHGRWPDRRDRLRRRAGLDLRRRRPRSRL